MNLCCWCCLCFDGNECVGPCPGETRPLHHLLVVLAMRIASPAPKPLGKKNFLPTTEIVKLANNGG